ncbi:LysE family translocator [Burkholderia thailandensis]|nr:LysE family translocator [Burkholderia thailandensis]MDD1483972.1 LysE family translocator [Burkholderia thailandensis]MDD1490055.1 LysE family translocator [Burkholderia thailandensis]MDD1495982.1 LysE family translocator [Burkholderia thailandensis]PJO68637.1 LysE family translocator [Burkholderia thailandensis]
MRRAAVPLQTAARVPRHNRRFHSNFESGAAMNLHTWWLFVATVFVVSAIPGPNMLLVMTHGARHGLRRSTATMSGCMTALVAMLSVSAAGLGVFLEAWPAMFDALRFAGAAYLIYLGVKAWRARIDGQSAADAADAAPHAGRAGAIAPASRWALFRNGFLVAGSNPKAILFAAALLPQFIDASAPTLPQFGILVATFAVIEVSWYIVYASFGTRIGVTLRSANVAKAFNRLTGGLFVGFGAMMALVRH